MTERVQIYIKICVELEHSSIETIWMIQKAAAMGNWWLAASSQHTHHVSHLVQRFLAKHQITQVTQPPYNPDLVPGNFWLFPKLKSPLKGKRFQAVDEIQENNTGQLMAIRRTVEVPRCLLWRGLRHHCSMNNISCIFFNKCLYFFILHGWIPSGQTSYSSIFSIDYIKKSINFQVRVYVIHNNSYQLMEAFFWTWMFINILYIPLDPHNHPLR